MANLDHPHRLELLQRLANGWVPDAELRRHLHDRRQAIAFPIGAVLDHPADAPRQSVRQALSQNRFESPFHSVSTNAWDANDESGTTIEMGRSRAVRITASNAGFGCPARSNNNGWLVRPRTGQPLSHESPSVTPQKVTREIASRCFRYTRNRSAYRRASACCTESGSPPTYGSSPAAGATLSPTSAAWLRVAAGNTSMSSSVMFTFTPSAAMAAIVESCWATAGHVILLCPCKPTASTWTRAAWSFRISAMTPLRFGAFSTE